MEASIVKKIKKDNVEVKLGPFLPNEIFSEILSWLPAKYLGRCKCVCKEWCNLIENRSFATKHLSRCSLVSVSSVYLKSKQESLDVDGTIVREKFMIMASCVGLVSEKGGISGKCRLRNLTTQEIVYLPDPHQGTFKIFINYDYSFNEIKLVSVYRDDENNSTVEGFQVLNLDRDDMWRPLKFPILENHKIRQVTKSFFLMNNKAFYHVQRAVYGSKGYIEVNSFDMKTECCFSNTLPGGFFSDQSNVMSMKWNDCIAFGDIVEYNLNVIVLEDEKKNKWSEKKIVIPLPFLKRNPDIKKLSRFSAAFNLGILQFVLKNESFIYDTRSRKLTPTKNVIPPCVLTFKRNAAQVTDGTNLNNILDDLVPNQQSDGFANHGTDANEEVQENYGNVTVSSEHPALSSTDSCVLHFNFSEVKVNVLNLLFKEVGRLNSGVVLSCQFSTDGRFLAWFSEDSKFRIWEVRTGHLITPPVVLGENITDIRFKKGCYTFATASRDRTVQLRSAENLIQTPVTLFGHLTEVLSLDFHPTDEILCSSDADRNIMWWNVKESRPIRTKKLRSFKVDKVRYQPQSGKILAVMEGLNIHLMEDETGNLLRGSMKHDSTVKAFCWDTSGAYIASVAGDSARVWSIDRKQCIHRTRTAEENLQSCAFHPMYPEIVIIAGDKLLYLWDTKKGSTWTVKAHGGLISSLAASATTVASGSHDQYLKLWKTELEESH
ncbi:hypothetical protein LWI29_027135 [Acer saccharum]|uniref:F-box domain-containing protein n=1 Tax=Acer saccharum TaxID=4024 RepID=A0AA39RWV3_ACESA|nr:hypothetical protein LWI29_027135 [Acer saccharum]